MTRRILSTLVLPALVAATLHAQARPPRDGFARLRHVVTRIMDSLGIPGAAVAVAADGRILWEQGFGWADRERRTRATEHTMFSLASISKPLTATGLMVLVERGEVELDRPADAYLATGRLSGLAGDAAAATVRRVLSHTAGLPLHYHFYYETESYREPPMDETIARYGIVVYPPGDVYHYSNFGYGLLDHIIARVSGQGYADFMRTEVFLPLGLNRTSVHIGPGRDDHAARRYDSNQQPLPAYDFDHDGGSAVYASAHDLARFGMFHLKHRLAGQRRILADSTVDLMQRVATPGDSASGYGLGWGITADDNGYRRISHTGGMPGVATVLHLYPAAGAVIVVLTNRSTPGAGRIAAEIAAAVLPRYADTLRARRARAEPRRFPSYTTPTELAGQWTGMLRTWQGTIPFSLAFRADGAVHATLGDQPPTLVNAPSWQDQSFAGRFAGTIPTPDARRHPHSIVLQLRLVNKKLIGQATAQTPTEPLHFALSSYVELAHTPAPAAN